MRRHAKTILVAAACAAFFAVYAFLPLTAPLRFTSPDENANYFFAGLFREQTKLWAFDSLNLTAPGLIHPRSVRVVGDFLVPGGFLGLPVIFGGIAKAFGMGIVPLLTPLLGVLGALAWGAFMRRCFGRGVGTWSAVLLLAQPAWWYESSRPLMPNVLFATLTIAGAWLLIAAPVAAAIEKRKIEGARLLRETDGALGGMLLALALAVRMSEAYWFVLGAAVLLIAYRKALPWRRLVIAAVAGGLVMFAFLSLQKTAYGSLFATGYGAIAQGSPVPDLPAGKGNALLGPLRPWLFPLGFAPRTALGHFAEYGLRFFCGWSLLVGVALLAAARTARRSRRPLPRAAAVFAVLAALVSGWLIAFYGSWTVSDNPDPSLVTIGSSYLRYWLPIFVLSTVPVAWLMTNLSVLVPERRRVIAGAAAFAVIVAASGLAVFAAPQEGLLALRQTIIRDDARVRVILEKTPPGSLIVVDRADKLIFPARSVMYPLRSDATYAALPKLTKRTSVFYYGITLPEKDVRYLNEEKLASDGLTISQVVSFGDETLYEIR